MDTIITKKCTKCGVEKFITEFYRNSTHRGGYASECKSCTLKYCSEYQRNHKADVNERARKRYAKNPKKYRKQSSEWYKAHPDVRKEVVKKSERKHPRPSDKNSIYCNNRRARRINAEGNFTLDEWKNLCDKYKNKCLCCGRDDVKLSPDHVVPLFLNGTNWISNIQPLCRSCNSKKGIKIIDYRKEYRI